MLTSNISLKNDERNLLSALMIMFFMDEVTPEEVKEVMAKLPEHEDDGVAQMVLLMVRTFQRITPDKDELWGFFSSLDDLVTEEDHEEFIECYDMLMTFNVL